MIDSTVWDLEKNINELWEKIPKCAKRVDKVVVNDNRTSMPNNKQTRYMQNR